MSMLSRRLEVGSGEFRILSQRCTLPWNF